MVQHNADAYRRLIDIGRALSAEQDLDSLLERILKEAKSLVNADAGTLYLVTRNRSLRFSIVLNDTLNIADGGSSASRPSLPEIPLELADGKPNLGNIASRAANTGTIVNLPDVYAVDEGDSDGARRFDELTGYRSRSFLTVPLQNFRGDPIGVLQLLNAIDDAGNIVPFAPETEPLVEALASQASIAVENRRLLDEHESLKHQLEQEVDQRTEELKTALDKLSDAHIILKEMTTLDAVTGIRNRRYFEDVLAQEWRRAVRQKYEIALLMFDIDHFKRVNDTYGHLAGDECLAQVAKTVDGMFNRPSDVVARYGGEEFVVIAPYLDRENAVSLAEQVRARIESMQFSADGHQIGVTISVGVATLLPGPTNNIRRLIGAADTALYEAKSGGRNQVVAWTAPVDD